MSAAPSGRSSPLRAHLCRLLARRRRSALVRWGARKCRRYLECYENFRNYDLEENGEAFVLRALSGEPFRCLLDVGANVGAWTRLAGRAFPGATVHCFEVHEETARTLRERTADMANVVVNAVGLADADKEVRLKCFSDLSVLTSMYDLPHDVPSRWTWGRLTTAERYLRARGIDHVDMVKIDVEGAEHLVLQGLRPALARGAVDVVQFEYGQGSITTRFLLRDFYELLTPLGYRIGKIYPNYVDFRDYELDHETFDGPNFLAVRRARDDLVRRLA